MIILGVRHGHDSSAAIIIDGKVIADASEERFTRQKNDTSFPLNAIKYCLKEAGVKSTDIDVLAIPTKGLQDSFRVFFDIPKIALDKIDGTKKSLKSRIGEAIAKDVLKVSPYTPSNSPVLPIYEQPFKLKESCEIIFVEHHLAHAASACYTSGLNEGKAMVATMDGIGDNVSLAIWKFENNKIEKLISYDGSASLGWFYSCATEGMDWRQSSDEWKVMGLAPYGKPQPGALKGFHPEFEDGKLVKPFEFGGFGRWNDHGANHYHNKHAIELKKLVQKLGREDFAAEVQRISEEQAFKIILPWLEKLDTRNLFCAGGFFLNVKFNQRLWYSGKLDMHWIYPNCGDSGLPVGAALYIHFMKNPGEKNEALKKLYYGPEFSNEQIKEVLDDRNLDYEYVENPSHLAAEYLAKNYAVAWYQGKMEAGPRALGNRSILMSPLRAENKDLINEKVKFRETFRPFTPSVLYDKIEDYFVKPRNEFFMVTSFDVLEEKKDKIPAVVHVDGTARPQMVKQDFNPRYYELIKHFGEITGESIILNTSFNIKGEPIILHPREAIKCFYDTGLDVLVMGNFVLRKKNINL